MAQHHVFGHGLQPGQIHLLIDGGDAGALGLGRRGEIDLLAGKLNAARVAAVHAGQDLEQRGFARAVLADQGVDFAGRDTQFGVDQGMHAGKGFVHMTHVQQRRQGGRRGIRLAHGTSVTGENERANRFRKNQAGKGKSRQARGSGNHWPRRPALS